MRSLVRWLCVLVLVVASARALVAGPGDRAEGQAVGSCTIDGNAPARACGATRCPRCPPASPIG